MKKTILLLLAIALSSCKQTPVATPKTVATETATTETVNSERTYQYADPTGKEIIIQNSRPSGIRYTGPNGKLYSKILFWTQITNKTENPLNININLPEQSFQVPTLPNKYFKIIIPPDTMSVDKEPLPDYGIANLNAYLDQNLNKPSILQRTINPNQSSAFFVAILFDVEVPGPTRTALYLKGQDLYYKVARFAGKQGGTLVDQKEIHLGTINLKNIKPKN